MSIIPKRDISLLQKIAKHCREIAETHTEFGNRRELFQSDKPYFKSVSMDLLQIGELANHLSNDFLQKHENIPFPQIIGLRNIVHTDMENLPPILCGAYLTMTLLCCTLAASNYCQK